VLYGLLEGLGYVLAREEQPAEFGEREEGKADVARSRNAGGVSVRRRSPVTRSPPAFLMSLISQSS